MFSIENTVIIDDKLYYVINSFEPWQETQYAELYLREEAGVIYWFKEDSEYVYLDTSKILANRGSILLPGQ